MRGLLTRAQLGLMRLIGMRKLHEAFDVKADAFRTNMLESFERLQAGLTEHNREVSERLRSLEERLIALGDELSRQGGAATERGDADQNTFRKLQTELEEVRKRSGGSSRAVSELRAEISGLRADFSREIESTAATNGGPDDLRRVLGSVLRQDSTYV